MQKKAKKERKYDLLRLLVDEYVGTAEPVGSEAMRKKYRLSWSPATIRNDLSELENEGLLAKPHTSGGRVPTNKAYCLIRDEIMEDPEETDAPCKLNLRGKAKTDPKDAFDMAARELAKITEHLAFGGLFGEKGLVECGLPSLVREPEFEDREVMAGVAAFLEKMAVETEAMLSKLLPDPFDTYIGEENVYPEIKSCSLLVAAFRHDDGEKGFVGLLGPTRMPYERNIAILRQMVEELGR